MTRIEFKSRVGPDGVLSLTVPVGAAEANNEVTVIVESSPSGNDGSSSDWQDFVRETYGSCAGLGLEAPPDLPPDSRTW